MSATPLTISDVSRIRSRLPVVMAEHRLKQRQLAEASGIRQATISQLYNEAGKGVQFDTLAQLIDGLKKLTGKTYAVGDLLEYVADE